MTLVAGVDSSTQSCKVVIRDAETGQLVREGRAKHPDGTEVDPQAWWVALAEAAEQAGGLDDVAAIGVGGQQHGMVCLDADGRVVRDALLWNDTRSAGAAEDLIRELGGPAAWAEAVGTVPVASITATKLRWLRDHEPENAAKVAAVCLPHDWLTWRLRRALGSDDLPPLDELWTDRGDASGTGYWSPRGEAYRSDLLELAFGATPHLPQVAGPSQVVGEAFTGAKLAPGTGDNAAAALGVQAGPGDVTLSIGTSGVVGAVSNVPTADPSGSVAGFADATGRFLPLAVTLNAARVLDAAAAIVQVPIADLAELALRAPSAADGLVVVPYLEGERTPNKPDALGAIHGLQLSTATPQHLARAAVEGMLCGLADGMDAMVAVGVEAERLLLVGGGAKSEAVRRVAPEVFGLPVAVPPPGEYVADGAARQAAWVLTGGDEPPVWPDHGATAAEEYTGAAVPRIREQYAAVRDLTASR
ncbi:xylulokinase [Jatrophihabitans sp. YIM 134969]